MIVRRWEARATPDGADKYQAHFATVVVDKLKALDGFRGAQVFRSVESAGRVHLMDLTYWESLESIVAFAGADVGTAVVDEHAQRLLLDFDTTAAHFTIEVDATLTPGS
jgi:heme-degrading monooxygenase HmoA